MTTSDDPGASAPGASAGGPPSERRVIKRYSNRKLYDTKGSSYVTLLQIAEIIRSGEDVEIIDNATKEDKTDVTLALIISEELRSRPRAIPLSTLKALIRHKGERILTQLRDGPIGKLIPRESPEAGPSAPEPAAERSAEGGRREHGDEDMTQAKEGRGLRATLEQWQSAIDERVRALAPNSSAFRQLEEEVRRLTNRIESLEKRLQNPAERSGGGGRDGGE